MDILHYYNRDIISQLYFELNEKMVIEINSKNSINAGSHLRAKISALFGGTEAELNGELYHEKLTKELIPDIKYVKKTIEMISAKSVDSDIFPSKKFVFINSTESLNYADNLTNKKEICIYKFLLRLENIN